MIRSSFGKYTMRSSSLIFFSLVCCLVADGGELTSGGHAPEQVHIALGKEAGVMSVSWVTLKDKYKATSTVMYGEIESDLDQEAIGTQHQLEDKGDEKRSYVVHVANMTGLRPDTRYFYKVGSNDYGWSDLFQFRTLGRVAKDLSVAVFGDLGLANMQAIKCLKKEAKEETVDLLLHSGDLAYDLHSDNGRVGDEWMRKMEPVTSKIPYMVLAGNHEAQDAFNHYTQRFRNMPSNSGILRASEWDSAPNNWFYSFNVGMVHFVMLSTELYFYYPTMVERQYRWLEQDLKTANQNRTLAPWIIVLGHRPLYCSGNSNCDHDATILREGSFDVDDKHLSGFGLEKLFYKYGVDMYVCGHTHNYERMYDIAPYFYPAMPWASGYSSRTTVDMPATTYVVVGTGGTQKMSEFQKPRPFRSAVRDMEHFGYAKFRVHNATHLSWEQVLCDDRFGESLQGGVLDEVVLVQRRHGSFSERNGAVYQAEQALEKVEEMFEQGGSVWFSAAALIAVVIVFLAVLNKQWAKVRRSKYGQMVEIGQVFPIAQTSPFRHLLPHEAAHLRMQRNAAAK